MKLNMLLTLLTLSVAAIPSIGDAQPGGGGPVGVIATTVENRPITDEIEALGTLSANENVILSSTVTETVTDILFEDNERVKKGQILIEMDREEEKAELAEEESTLEEAQRQVDRLEPLVKRGAASQASLDENRREVKTSQARINAIQSRINQRVIRAPFDGVLGLRNLSVGATVQPGTTITTIDDDSVMKLDFSVPEIFMPTLAQGLDIQATAKAFPNETFTGTVSSVDSRIDPVTRSVTARALIDNPDRKLKAGMLMRVTLQKNPRQALMIPEEAITIEGAQSYVMVAEDGEGGQTIAKKQAVELGVRQGGNVEILSGLEADQKVITHGTLKARPGSPVKIRAMQTGNETLEDLLNQNNDTAKDAD